MRLAWLVSALLAACTGNDALPGETQQTGMMSYGTRPHVRALPASAAEGDSGDSLLIVTVTLSPRTASLIHVDYITADGSAKEGSDYRRAKGRLTFKPGITEQSIEIAIIGDDVAEGDEWFQLLLHVAHGAVVDEDVVRIAIVDDD